MGEGGDNEAKGGGPLGGKVARSGTDTFSPGPVTASRGGAAPAGDALLAAELEDARERLVQVLLVPVAVTRHVLPQLRSPHAPHSAARTLSTQRGAAPAFPPPPQDQR